jgi:hypothetical protein
LCWFFPNQTILGVLFHLCVLTGLYWVYEMKHCLRSFGKSYMKKSSFLSILTQSLKSTPRCTSPSVYMIQFSLFTPMRYNTCPGINANHISNSWVPIWPCQEIGAQALLLRIYTYLNKKSHFFKGSKIFTEKLWERLCKGFVLRNCCLTTITRVEASQH